MALSCEIFLALATFALCLSAFVSLYHFVAITFMSVCVLQPTLLSTTFCQITYANLSTFTSASLPRKNPVKFSSSCWWCCCFCFLREKLLSKPRHEVANTVRALISWTAPAAWSLTWPAPIHNVAAGHGARSCRGGLLKTHSSSKTTPLCRHPEH